MLWGSLIKIWNPANHMKKQNKKHQNAKSIGEKVKIKGLMFFVSNSNMWTAKHLAQASCTELTLPNQICKNHYRVELLITYKRRLFLSQNLKLKAV